MQTTILNILIVVIMMRMTGTSYMQFYENVDMVRYEAFVIVAETKGCHGDESENDATATYRLSGSPRGYRCKRKWRERAKDGGVIPVTGFPRVDGGAKRGKQLTFTGRYNIQTCIRSREVDSGLYLWSVRFGAHWFVEEVVVLTCSRVDGRGSRDLGDGSCTCRR